MQVREVALDRDVRAVRLLPAPAYVWSRQWTRRVFSVVALLMIDLVGLTLAATAVSSIQPSGQAQWIGLTVWSWLACCGIIAVLAALRGLYGRRYARRGAGLVASTWVAAFLISLLALLIVDADAIAAGLVLAWLLAIALSLGGRRLYDAYLTAVFGEDGENPPALLLGSAHACRRALGIFKALPPERRVTVVGVVLPGDEPADAWGAPQPPVLGAYGDLRAAIARSQATDVILADRLSLNGHLRGVMDACRAGAVGLKIVVTDAEVNGDAVSYVPGLDCPLYVVRPRPATKGSYLVKQVADRLVAALLLLLLSPFLLVIAVAIMLTSRGPVLFADERVGIGQRPFRCYKFRTMRQDAAEAQAELEEANEAGEVLFKIRDDPRVTSVGRVLRRLSLDELPQLFNVLKGDMSLVGPRPLPLRDCAFMDEAQRQRHVVLPGLTGLWQVSGRSDLDFCDMLRLDLQYIETWSFKSDLHVIWRTIGVVVHSRGAY